MPGTGTKLGLERTRGTETGHAGRGIHTFGPGGAWRDGIGVLGQKKLAWENWEPGGENLGYLDPGAGEGRTGGAVGQRLLEFLRTVATWVLVTMPHASVQGNPKLGLLHLLRSTEGAGSPARPGAAAALGSL